MFTRKHQFGIFLGIMTGILFSTFLNWWLNWTGLAIGLGLITGLEAGLWAGAPILMKKIHVDSFRNPLAKKKWGFILTLVLYLSAAIFFFLGVISIVETSKIAGAYTTPLLADTLGFTGSFGETSEGTKDTTSLAFFLYSISTVLFGIVLTSSNKQKKLLIGFILCSVPFGILISSLTFMFFLVGIIVLLLILTAASLYGLIFLLKKASIALLKAASHNEAATITVGVISGVLSGLGFGTWWTKLEFTPTLLACLVGCAVGYTFAYATYKISLSTWFQNKYMAVKMSA